MGWGLRTAPSQGWGSDTRICRLHLRPAYLALPFHSTVVLQYHLRRIQTSTIPVEPGENLQAVHPLGWLGVDRTSHHFPHSKVDRRHPRIRLLAPPISHLPHNTRGRHHQRIPLQSSWVGVEPPSVAASRE